MISPLLANLYLHGFDKMFHQSNGPRQWANARLIRYADDFVILAKSVGGRIKQFVEQTLQARLGLTINREKTRTVTRRKEGASLDFLGYMFRYDKDRSGGNWRYLNLCPASKSMQRERDKLREMTGPDRCFVPIPVLIAQINTHLRGWGNYFSLGYPRDAFRQINHYVRARLEKHLKRRSQRPFRVTGGVSWYTQLHRLGLKPM